MLQEHKHHQEIVTYVSGSILSMFTTTSNCSAQPTMYQRQHHTGVFSDKIVKQRRFNMMKQPSSQKQQYFRPLSKNGGTEMSVRTKPSAKAQQVKSSRFEFKQPLKQDIKRSGIQRYALQNQPKAFQDTPTTSYELFQAQRNQRIQPIDLVFLSHSKAFLISTIKDVAKDCKTVVKPYERQSSVYDSEYSVNDHGVTEIKDSYLDDLFSSNSGKSSKQTKIVGYRRTDDSSRRSVGVRSRVIMRASNNDDIMEEPVRNFTNWGKQSLVTAAISSVMLFMQADPAFAFSCLTHSQNVYMSQAQQDWQFQNISEQGPTMIIADENDELSQIFQANKNKLPNQRPKNETKDVIKAPLNTEQIEKETQKILNAVQMDGFALEPVGADF